MRYSKLIVHWLLVLSVAALALLARSNAAKLLPIDYDEDDYMSAAQYYADAIRAGDWQAAVDYEFLYEHPPLAKLAYAMVLLSLPPAPRIVEPADPNTPPAQSLPEPHLTQARKLSVWLGVIEVAILGILNPLAGLFIALNTWNIKYTSQVMLESLPVVLSTLAAVFYLISKRKALSMRNPWLLASALALGLTTASKYMYVIVGVAILLDWWLDVQSGADAPFRALWRWAPLALAWGILAAAVFFAADLHLWNQPAQRLSETLAYHIRYSQSEHVAQAGHPFWQPLVWLTMPVPWNTEAFSLPHIDLLVFFLALFGLRRVWNQQRIFALWFAIGLLFLIVWPTKWPQYILLLSAPLGLSAAHGVREALSGVTWYFNKDRSRPELQMTRGVRALTGRQNLSALPWLLPGAIVLLLITFFPLIYQFAIALTDLNVMSLKDGINGGIWREVWNGVMGRAPAAEVDFSFPARVTTVRFAGINLLKSLFSGGVGSLLAFEVIWTALSVGLQLLIGMGVALLLERPNLRFKRFWQLVLILPWAIPEFAGALMWLQIYDPQFGWAALSAQHPYLAGSQLLTSLAGWRSSADITLAYMLVTATWYGFPIMMLAATAGLKFIPVDVYDSAAIDGATGWELFRWVIWPLLLPVLVPVLVIRAIFAFNQFYIFYVFDPRDGLYSLSYLSYFFVRNGAYAFSAVLNIFVVAVLLLLIILFNRWSKVTEESNYA